jgi:hypothetical protein
MPKVVLIDNFNRENISDKLVIDNLSHELCELIAIERNNQYGGVHSPSYFVVKPDDYQLYIWEP